ncbi:chemotaxis protein CheW [Pedomonas mirosovicensis]|uniref:chemotaxis protein CheW n=1 Tax=Pedomonas mirosovicensis TaxID=2908641 RepID=UPI00216A1485|nr:chemotaxis protein CheW [Pedomonas mirosovicensis]MCH8684652.1 chemotaxis protein CheW [Pedomonas mirosovicensis]
MKEGSKDFVTIRLAGQLLGIPVLLVHDVLKLQNVTRVPLAPPWVAGVLNLRGRIVTAIDLRARLDMPVRMASEKAMSVVVDFKGESYSLIIDSVGEVLSLPDALYEKNPVTLDQKWREVSDGIYRLQDELLVVLDVRRVLDVERAAAA